MSTPDHADIAALDLTAIGVRVRQLLIASGLDGTDFAARVGVPYGTMRAYVSGNRAPSAEFLAGCWRAFGYQASWILTGDGAMHRSGQPTVASGDDPVPIARLDLKASAGPGTLNDTRGEYRVTAMHVQQSWLQQRRLNARNLRVISVRGSSMSPVLHDGDQVVVDLSDTVPRSGFAYVLRRDDELLIKYLEKLPGGILRVSSANPAFQPYDIDQAQAADVTIIGRVVASTHDW